MNRYCPKDNERQLMFRTLPKLWEDAASWGTMNSDGFCAVNRVACIKPSRTADGPMVSLPKVSALACSWLSLSLVFGFLSPDVFDFSLAGTFTFTCSESFRHIISCYYRCSFALLLLLRSSLQITYHMSTVMHVSFPSQLS